MTGVEIAVVITLVVSFIAIITIAVIVHGKHQRCWPFKYGGFTKENGYEDLQAPVKQKKV